MTASKAILDLKNKGRVNLEISELQKLKTQKC